MRKGSKLTALLLALALTAGLTVTAFAADATQYTDVPQWAQPYVAEMTERGLIEGTSDTTFGANEPMNRADLVTALYRLADKPDVPEGAVNPFKDVKEDAAYRDAAVWAFSQKIINGKTENNDTFDPEASAKREEIAKIICEFASRQVGKSSALTNRKDEMSAYPDAADVSAWAKDYMNWAVASEFITGSDNNMLKPQGTATRAEVSAILCRYIADAGTGDASLDDPRNTNPTKDTELLVVSFGTSFNDSRVKTIKAIEDDLAAAFPDYDVRRGFTADIIIEHVYRRDGEQIDKVKEALDKAVTAGVKNLVVQPTHLMNGFEYGDLRNLLEKKYADKFESIKIGAPLLTTDDDFAKVADAMVKATEDQAADGKTAVCYMGHGTAAASNGIYAKMQQVLTDAGHKNYFVGTVESEPTAEDLAKLVKEAGYTKVVLRPMMIVAGDHANNDMADENDPESWYSVFNAAGLDVQTDVRGLGEIKAIRDLLVAHAKAAVDLKDVDIPSEFNPENPDNKEELADGVYDIQVECEQAMFKIDSCTLTVKDGKMTADLVLGSESFDKMFVGTASAANLAKDGVVNGAAADGKTTFTLPVAELDKPLDYASHSVKNDKWYDRTLTFLSDTAVAK